MSSTLKRLTLGRRPEQDQARSLMLSRLGIAEQKPPALDAPQPEPLVEALAPQRAPEPEPVRPFAWRTEPPANDELEIQPPPAPEPEPFAETAERVEDPFEAIRRQYRKQPAALPSIAVPNIEIKREPVGVRRRKAGELSDSRKVIWGLSWLAAALIGWGLLTGDENSPIIQIFGMLLP